MDYHQNARLTMHSREQLARRVVDQGLSLKQAAAGFHVSAKMAKPNASSRPRCANGPTPALPALS